MNRLRDNINSVLKILKTRNPKNQRLKFSHFKRLIPYVKKHWKKVTIASFLMIIVSLFALPVPLLIKYIIDDVITAKNFHLLSILVLLLVIIQFSKLILSFFTNYFFNILTQEIQLTIKNDLFKKILVLPLSFFDTNQTGYIMSRIGEVNSLGFLFSNSVVRIVIAVFEFIFCLSILFYMHWKLTLISLIILPFFYLLAKFYSQGIRKASKDLYEKSAYLSSQLQESISGVETIKTFASEKKESQKIHHNLKKLMQSSIRSNIMQSISGEILALVGALGGFAVLWYGGGEIIRGNFTIGGYIAFAAYLGKLYGPTQIFASLSLTIQPASIALIRVNELFDLTSDSEDKFRIVKLSKPIGRIEFKNVSFSYDYKKDSIQNISFAIEKGEKVAFVGANGSGKSTIIKLLLGLYQTRRGKILIDNQDINEIILSTLREKISTVSQNTFLFNCSIKNNIRYSKPRAKDEEIIQAAKNAGAYDFIMNLDRGFDTIIGEQGKKLSGGERQKTSISRAILRNADIIILDEATSQLDTESEEKIKKMINEKFAFTTCIIITHKQPTNLNLNKIYVLNKGKLIQFTTFNILTNKKHEINYF